MNLLFSHEQWPAVQHIYDKMTTEGYSVFVAGGAVRDGLMGRVPNDVDLATDATPEQVETLFERVVMVGKQFGVCRVVIGEQVVEIATFREDGFYEDGRRPDSVTYSSPKEDAIRRDFTINGMFYDIASDKVVDYVEGKADLEKGVIRAIGDPEKRFMEDKLRILRGLRFLSQLELPLDTKTAVAMKAQSSQLGQVSQERVTQEWEKLLLGPGVCSAIELSHQLGIWQQVFADWPFLPEDYEAIFGNEPLTFESLWALWFLIHWRDDRDQLKKRMGDWKLPRDLVTKTVFARDQMSFMARFAKMEPVDVALFLGKEEGLFAADLFPMLHHRLELTEWAAALQKAEVYFEGGSLPSPLVTGSDLLEQGVIPGPKMSQTLKRLYRAQVQRRLSRKTHVLAIFREEMNGELFSGD